MSKSTSRPGFLWLWELATGEEVWQMRSEAPASAIAFSGDGQYVAATFKGANTQVWSVPEGREVIKIPYWGSTLKFSPDGRYLAIGGSVWDLTRDSGREPLLPDDKVCTLQHEDDVFDVAFSPDGQYIATGSQDRTARVWALPNGEEIARMTHSENVYEVRFSPDGQYLAARAQDGITMLWRLWPGDLPTEACRRVERNLTSEEWRTYFGDEPYRKTCDEKH
jgi:WD40 repeat protein